jgi:hypothetical protein
MRQELRLLYSFPRVIGRPGVGTTACHQVRELIELGVSVDVYCFATERPLEGVRSS